MSDDQTKLKLRIFRRYVWVALIFVYFLVIIAGFVRSSGSGMGCPDWPLCFGKLVPPIYEYQLPENYQITYAHRGYKDTVFNAFKTWTEYINRLFGIITGFSIIALFIYSLRLIKIRLVFPVLSFLVLCLVCLQGGLGALVVFSNLAPYMVTIHMLVAVLILLLLLYLLEISNAICIVPQKQYTKHPTRYKRLFYLCLIILLSQLFFGIQVREAVDVVWKQMLGENRHLWLDTVGFYLDVHKSIALVLVSLLSYFSFKLYNFSPNCRLLAISLCSAIFIEFLIGSILVLLHLPAFIQPLHLGSAFLLIGLLFQIGLRLRYFPLISRESKVN